METFIYMVRHGDSPKNGCDEKSRGLTEKGIADISQVTDILSQEKIEVFTSSPYQRAILTIRDLAEQSGKEILIYEDLKERVFSSDNLRMPDEELFPLLEKSFLNPDFTMEGAESNYVCQIRAVEVLKELLQKFQGRKIAIGTHGAVMTLMMNYFDRKYDYNFLLQTSKPDIYRMEFYNEELIRVDRLWNNPRKG